MDGVRIGERTAETLDPEEARQRIEDGTIAGGMALKVRVALEASAAGIPEVVIAGKARLLGQFRGRASRAGPASGFEGLPNGQSRRLDRTPGGT